MNNLEAAAIERFILNVTLPLLYEQGEKSYLWGTGTLFSMLDRYFVVTASHLFDPPFTFENLGFPTNPKNGSLYTFGKMQRYSNDSKIFDFDIAVIEVQQKESIERLKDGWQFLNLNNIAAPTSNGNFLLAGYPSSLSKEENGWLKGTLITACSKRMTEVPIEASKPFHPELDLFFNYDNTVTTLYGKELETSELPGTSGASVWQIDNETRLGIWSPELAIKVVGVQSSYLRNKYFRAKNWWAVAKAFSRIDDDLAVHLEEVLQ